MTENIELDFEGVERVPLREFTEQAYLDYSMYVVLDRALPQVRDGMKPVQRRIVYSMRELGLASNAKPRKSARTVGDVIGKYHPHGDQACYDAMVLMAQPFSYRYPTVFGQGNFGSTDDPKSFAAMRYTEARLTAYAEALLAELDAGTVEFTANFDGMLEEPVFLPARLPNIILNGAMGIAVGMSTDIPPHNLREVAAALVRLLEKPKSTVKELMAHIKAPDFPGGAELITPHEEILKIYETGNGTLRLRATYEKEGDQVVITSLPHQVSGSKVQEQIAQQLRSKKLPMVEDLRDESDHENPIRLVIVPRSNRVRLDELMTHLFATTDLEKTVRVNINAIALDGRPRIYDLKSLLKEWLDFRIETVKRRTQHRLEKVEARLHILDGRMKAFLKIDAVIKVIREEDEPKPVLMKRFKLSEIQAEDILNIRLRQLARLEEIRIKAERKDLNTEHDDLLAILKSPAKLKRTVRDEIRDDAEKFGDDRRTTIVARAAAQAFDESTLVPNEPLTVVLSQRGLVRAAKGHEIDPETLTYRSGDQFLSAAAGRSNQSAVFLDSTGRAYTLSAHTLPSARGQGEPLSSRFNVPDGAQFAGVMAGDGDGLWLVASDAGYGFTVRMQELMTRNKSGKVVLRVPKGCGVLPPAPAGDADYVAAVSNIGRLLVFEIEELPELARGKGNKMLGLPARKVAAREEFMVAMTAIDEEQTLLVTSGQRQMTIKYADLDKYFGERGRRGALLPRGWRKVDRIEPA